MQSQQLPRRNPLDQAFWGLIVAICVVMGAGICVMSLSTPPSPSVAESKSSGKPPSGKGIARNSTKSNHPAESDDESSLDSNSGLTFKGGIEPIDDRHTQPGRMTTARPVSGQPTATGIEKKLDEIVVNLTELQQAVSRTGKEPFLRPTMEPSVEFVREFRHLLETGHRMLPYDYSNDRNVNSPLNRRMKPTANPTTAGPISDSDARMPAPQISHRDRDSEKLVPDATEVARSNRPSELRNGNARSHRVTERETSESSADELDQHIDSADTENDHNSDIDNADDSARRDPIDSEGTDTEAGKESEHESADNHTRNSTNEQSGPDLEVPMPQTIVSDPDEKSESLTTGKSTTDDSDVEAGSDEATTDDAVVAPIADSSNDRVGMNGSQSSARKPAPLRPTRGSDNDAPLPPDISIDDEAPSGSALPREKDNSATRSGVPFDRRAGTDSELHGEQKESPTTRDSVPTSEHVPPPPSASKSGSSNDSTTAVRVFRPKYISVQRLVDAIEPELTTGVGRLSASDDVGDRGSKRQGAVAVRDTSEALLRISQTVEQLDVPQNSRQGDSTYQLGLRNEHAGDESWDLDDPRQPVRDRRVAVASGGELAFEFAVDVTAIGVRLPRSAPQGVDFGALSKIPALQMHSVSESDSAMARCPNCPEGSEQIELKFAVLSGEENRLLQELRGAGPFQALARSRVQMSFEEASRLVVEQDGPGGQPDPRRSRCLGVRPTENSDGTITLEVLSCVDENGIPVEESDNELLTLGSVTIRRGESAILAGLVYEERPTPKPGSRLSRLTKKLTGQPSELVEWMFIVTPRLPNSMELTKKQKPNQPNTRSMIKQASAEFKRR